MSDSEERLRVLQMIEDGKITAAEGLRLLNALSGSPASGGGAETAGASEAPGGTTDMAGSPPIPDMGRWRNWWMIPLGAGISIIVLSSLLMYWAYTAGGFSFWFACATLPFIFGVIAAALASASRSARWIHIRVNTGEAAREGPRRIALSFPLPVRVTAWFLRTFGQFIPKLKDTGVDELILALEESTSPDNPLFVDVHEGEGGERVQVYIG
ncbi:MAG TPA: hypothetical protein VI793_00365 [Anaerolineales bacterium]|nr:hypothetical protein [Anaerolineales bacterium]